SDYTATNGVVTFNPGQTSQTINVPVTCDSLDEANETFTVTLSSPVNATITTAAGTATIIDDDGPSISINDAVVVEGNSGTTNAVFTVALQGQSFGDPTWFGGPLLGWKERDFVPLRLIVSGGPATNLTYTVYFDHTSSNGQIPGMRDLVNWTNTPNITITSGPTLFAPPGDDIWSYSFTINLTESNDGIVWFWGRVAAGAHLYPGASLHVSGSPSSLGVLQIHKPGPEAGSPDLAVTKIGPAFANAGQLINYTLNYTNDVANGN